jgi:hypothetical protein
MAVDRQDHLFVVQRPGGLLTNERFSGSDDTPPRPTAAFRHLPSRARSDGKLVNSWGGPGQGYDWPQSEHGVFVDQKDVVWLAGNGAKDHQILTFTKQGKFLRQFGKPGMSKGSDDYLEHARPRQPRGRSHEQRVVRGRRLRQSTGDRARCRHVRLQADVGRIWKQAERRDLGPYNPDAPRAQQFRLPHNISISRDGFVYVADRPNNRIQVFRKDGTYVKEVFISKRTLLQGAASGFALSPDPEQRFST